MNLNPCPFCGGDAKLLKPHELYFIGCTKCHASMGTPLQGWSRQEAAAEWWNHRPKPEVKPAPQEIVELPEKVETGE